MVYELSSADLLVKINSKGAEISSAIHKGEEYIWQAKPEVWPRHTPVLFPIVGRLKNNEYTYLGKTYSLSQHGFARDKEFKCVSRESDRIVFELKQDDETKKIFPFDFELKITYTLNENSIRCDYEVRNPSSNELYFGIGAHPGFRTEELSEYKLRFSAMQFEITALENGLLSNNKQKLHLDKGLLSLNKSLFDKDALVFENGQVEIVELVSRNGTGVELTCKGWPYFGIWSKKDCNEFVCLEPWYGITDSVNSTGDITQKKGIIKLEAGKKFECSFGMTFF